MDIQDNKLYQKVDKAITDVSNAYKIIQDKGGAVPAKKNIPNLIASINSIPAGNGETISTLTETKSIYPDDSTYIKEPVQADVSGYSSISINGSIMLSDYDLNDLNLDDMVKDNTQDDYSYVKSSNNRFVNYITCNYQTVYPKLLEQLTTLDNEELIKMSSFKIITGFSCGTMGDVSIIDNANFLTYTTALLVSNMNDIIISKFPINFNTIHYDYVDFEVNADESAIINTSICDYGHCIQDAAAFSQYSNFSDIINDLGNIYGSCTLSNNNDISTFMSSIGDNLKYFYRYRILYNINIFMNNLACYNTNIFVPRKQQAYKDIRTTIIKNTFKSVPKIDQLTDIIDENNVRLGYAFNNMQ